MTRVLSEIRFTSIAILGIFVALTSVPASAAQALSDIHPTLTIPGQEITQQAVKWSEPTLSIPPHNPATCVGDWTKQGLECVATLQQAIKNAKANGKIYVKPGFGAAENLSITKAVTICPAEITPKSTNTTASKMRCIEAPTRTRKFRLIREDKTKPCIKLSGNAGVVRISGMLLDDTPRSKKPCFISTGKKVKLSIEHSKLVNITMNLATPNAVALQDVTFRYSNLDIKSVDKMTLRGENVFYRSHLTLSDVGISKDPAPFEILSFTDGSITATGSSSIHLRVGEFRKSGDFQQSDDDEVYVPGKLSISGTGSSSLTVGRFENSELVIGSSGSFKLSDSLFVNSGISVSGRAIRTVNGNDFIDTQLELKHDGLLTVTGNTFLEEFVDEAIFEDEAPRRPSLLIASGVNQISENRFLAACDLDFPLSQRDPACACTKTPVLEFEVGASRSTRFSENQVCTDEASWVRGTITTDEVFRTNCLITFDKSVGRDSRSLYNKSEYRRSKYPPKSELIVTYVSPGRHPRDIEERCGEFLP